MKRQRSHDLWDAFLAFAYAAERIVNRSPRLKRLEGTAKPCWSHQAGAIDSFCETIAHIVQGALTGA